MHRLSLLILILLGFTIRGISQTPHGKSLELECSLCHNSASWKINRDSILFKHNTTEFPLTGQHQLVDCKSCHSSLIFSDANANCNSCHQDMHSQTVGNDCARCHTTNNWFITNKLRMHELVSFPLVGQHATAECADCHKSNEPLKFERIGTACLNCHQEEYEIKDVVDHRNAGFSTDCIQCHKNQANSWAASFDHNFFPLTKGHDIDQCSKCHTQGEYKSTPSDCSVCHLRNFNESKNPDHIKISISTDCASCHTTDPGWETSKFENHDKLYKIEGVHKTFANQCAECHHGNYDGSTPRTCFGCHSSDYKATINPDHEKSGFPTSCDFCHTQTNWNDGAFDHNRTKFPLTDAHVGVACLECHTNGYKSTPVNCVDCHLLSFNIAINPNHKTLNISTDCVSCHTTAAGWAPAKFAQHNTYYTIAGAHTAIANDCAACHKDGIYNGTTPETCVGCHLTDYNATTNPNHKTSNFPTTCESCHSQTAWAPANFDHNKTKFPLTGSHISVSCSECHKTTYTGTPTACSSCHLADFNTAINPNHKTLNISTDCASCHTTAAGWAPAKFAQHNTYYTIAGAHTAIANDCAACHKGNYNGTTPKTCVGCHLTDYNATTNPNHKISNFPTACESCHSQTAWAPANFDHNKTKFPLTGSHISVSCKECHKTTYTGTPTACTSCHLADFNTAINPNHKTLNISTDCASCHTTAAGWAPAKFAQHNTYYTIAGAHTAMSNDCAACHKGIYNGTTPKTCVGCHLTDYNATTNPNHKTSNFPTACESCHSQTAWAPANFDHNKTKFPLTGSHISVSCSECHRTTYTGTPTACSSCHLADFNTAINPNHKTLNISTDCASCHTTAAGWAPAKFAQHNTYYTIAGAHTAIANDCAACHKGIYNGTTPKTCVGCHLTDYNATTNPNHKTSNFPTTCESCHSQTAWAPANFDHNKTKFPLTGSHISVSCNECHKTTYTGTPTACTSCHLADFNTAINPNHKTLNISTDCASCHTTAAGWAPAKLAQHNTYYTIAGAHTAIANDCAACHKGIYNGTTPKTCVGCHLTDYNATTNPNHKTSNFPTACESCHSQTAWAPANFDHNKTKFPLKGSHISVSCSECHKTTYTGTPTACASCHLADFNTAINPNHKTLNISTDCASCHTTAAGWAPAKFAQHNTYYTIAGAHTAIANDCAACHKGNYNGTTPKTCVGCHLTDYNATTNPNHKTSNFPTSCESCHSQTAWAPANFDHNKTKFPLTGSHKSVSCSGCHKTTYTGTPTACSSCHLADFNIAINPNHKTLNISTDCASCHTTAAGWAPAKFAQHNTYYTIAGAHTAIANDCAACHKGIYNGTTPKTCVGCHLTDYNATTNPNHKTSNFPTACESCHSQTAWAPSTFNHDSQYFRIYSGKHRGKWSLCVECHTNATNFSVFSCTSCHEHNNKSETDKDHSKVKGYTYSPTSCYDCHKKI